MALYRQGFSPKDILDMYRLVDWLMMLPEDLNRQFTQNLIDYEEELKMPYISSAERYGREKGWNDGWEDGLNKGVLLEAREMVEEALSTRFQQIPVSILKAIRKEEDRQFLKQLLKKAILAVDITQFERALEERQ
ncbi:MAG: hypothetical protein HQK66_11460 [Desulfamplus sp.]|nr:hypothetical protein [Desulfamplus sp.]